MTTRTRSRGSSAEQDTRYFVELRDDKTKALLQAPSSGQLIRRPGFSPETMNDVTGSPHAMHDCSHEKRKCLDGKEITWTSNRVLFPYTADWYVYSQIKCVIPYSYILPNQDQHLGALSGIKALAVARVPAYSTSDWAAFVSLGESKDLASSGAVKSAAALARFAANCYQGARQGALKKLLSRDSKRALDALTKALKPKSVKEAWSTFLSGLSTISSVDMEWKYGIAPMLQDMQAANAAVATLTNLRQRLLDGVRVYGRASDVRRESQPTVSVPLPAGLGLGVTILITREKVTKTTAVASIVRKLNPGSSYNNLDWFQQLDIVNEINGLNPSAKGLWQLMPLSFVADWFFNVGNVLESLESLAAPIGTDFTSIDGLYSCKQETTVTGRPTFDPAGRDNDGIASDGVATRVTYVRNLDPLTGVPVLYVPPLTVPTKAGQWFSMAQLAFQRMLK